MTNIISYEDAHVDAFIAMEEYKEASDQYSLEIESASVCESLFISDPVEEGFTESVSNILKKIKTFFHNLRMKFVSFVKAFIRKVKGLFKKDKKENAGSSHNSTTIDSEPKSNSNKEKSLAPEESKEKITALVTKCQKVADKAEEIDDKLSTALTNKEDVTPAEVQTLKKESDASADEMRETIKVIAEFSESRVNDDISRADTSRMLNKVSGPKDLVTKSADRIVKSNPIKFSKNPSADAKASADTIVKMGIVKGMSGKTLPGTASGDKKITYNSSDDISTKSFDKIFGSGGKRAANDRARSQVGSHVLTILQDGDSSAALQAFNYAKKKISGNLSLKYDEYTYNQAYKKAISAGKSKDDAKWDAARTEFLKTCSSKGLADLMKLAKNR